MKFDKDKVLLKLKDWLADQRQKLATHEQAKKDFGVVSEAWYKMVREIPADELVRKATINYNNQSDQAVLVLPKGLVPAFPTAPVEPSNYKITQVLQAIEYIEMSSQTGDVSMRTPDCVYAALSNVGL